MDFIVPSQRDSGIFRLDEIVKARISYFKSVDAKTWGTSSNTSSVPFFLWQSFTIFGDPKKFQCKLIQKDFCEKECIKVSGQISRKWLLKSPYLDNRFHPAGCQNIAGFLIFSTFLFDIWPNLANSSCGWWLPIWLHHKLKKTEILNFKF